MLYLGSNLIHSEGARYLADGLKHNTVRIRHCSLINLFLLF